MPIDPVQSLAASALRLETEGSAGLVKLLAGETVQATVVAALKNGGLRLALANILFQGDRAVPAANASPGTRPAQIDVPAVPGIRVGDTVRLTITETAPNIAVRIQPITPNSEPPPHATTIVVTAGGRRETEPGAQTPDPARLPQAGFSRPPATPVTPPLPTAPSAIDSVTLSPEAALALLATEPEADASSQPPTARPLSPEARAAVAEMIPRAAANQSSLAPLMAQAAALSESPSLATLPAPLRAAVEALAGHGGVDAAELDGESLRRAIERAGPFFESRLALSLPAPDATRSPLPAQGDMKGVLLALRGLLKDMLGGAPAGPPAGDRPMPPRRGLAPMGQPSATAPMPDDDPGSAAQRLAGAVDGALDRIRLQQAAALPDDGGRATGRPEAPTADRLLELPIRLPGETPVLGLSIGPDGQVPRPGEPRGWRMRLSLDLADTGRIDGLVAVRGRLTTVHLTAAQAETAVLLRENLPALSEALIAADLDLDVVDLREAAPTAPEHGRSGSFLDRRS